MQLCFYWFIMFFSVFTVLNIYTVLHSFLLVSLCIHCVYIVFQCVYTVFKVYFTLCFSVFKVCLHFVKPYFTFLHCVALCNTVFIRCFTFTSRLCSFVFCFIHLFLMRISQTTCHSLMKQAGLSMAALCVSFETSKLKTHFRILRILHRALFTLILRFNFGANQA